MDSIHILRVIYELNDIKDSHNTISRKKMVMNNKDETHPDSPKNIQYKKAAIEMFLASYTLNKSSQTEPFFEFDDLNSLMDKFRLKATLNTFEKMYLDILYSFLKQYVACEDDLKALKKKNNVMEAYYSCLCPQEADVIFYAWAYHQHHHYPTNRILQSNNDNFGLFNISFLYKENKNLAENARLVTNYPKNKAFDEVDLLINYMNREVHVYNGRRNYFELDEKTFDMIYMRLQIKELGNLDLLFKYLNSLTDEGRAYVIIPKGAFVNMGTVDFREKSSTEKWIESIIDLGDSFKDDVKTQYLLVIFSRNNETFTYINTNKHPLFFGRDYETKTYEASKINHLYETKKFNKGVKLGDYFEVIRGYQIRSKSVVEYKNSLGEYQYLKIKDLSDNKIHLENTDSIDAPQVPTKYEIRTGDIIITTKGSNLEVALVLTNPSKKTIISNNLTIIRRKEECKQLIGIYYIYQYFITDYGLKQLEGIQSGSAVRTISVADLNDLEIPYCDLEKQVQFGEQFKYLEFKKEELLKEYTEKIKEQEAIFFELFDEKL